MTRAWSLSSLVIVQNQRHTDCMTPSPRRSLSQEILITSCKVPIIDKEYKVGDQKDEGIENIESSRQLQIATNRKRQVANDSQRFSFGGSDKLVQYPYSSKEKKSFFFIKL